ncbi:hypothetical protein F5Y10DRAFT_271432 [Nemania abortiva]|nr:hypothetical protein F5Y10DRAFT_271432 [Nemania abortiva]
MAENHTRHYSDSPHKLLLKVSVRHNKMDGASDAAITKCLLEEYITRSMTMFNISNMAQLSTSHTPRVSQEHFVEELEEIRNSSRKRVEFGAVACYCVHDVEDLRNALFSSNWQEEIAGSDEGWVNMESPVVSTGLKSIYLVQNRKVSRDDTVWLAGCLYPCLMLII